MLTEQESHRAREPRGGEHPWQGQDTCDLAGRLLGLLTSEPRGRTGRNREDTEAGVMGSTHPDTGQVHGGRSKEQRPQATLDPPSQDLGPPEGPLGSREGST